MAGVASQKMVLDLLHYKFSRTYMSSPETVRKDAKMDLEVPVPRGQALNLDFAAIVSGIAGSGITAAVLTFWRNTGITEAQLQERIASLKEEYTRGILAIQKAIEKDDSEGKLLLQRIVAENGAVTLELAKLQAGQHQLNLNVQRRLDDLEHAVKENTQIRCLMDELLTNLKRARE